MKRKPREGTPADTLEEDVARARAGTLVRMTELSAAAVEKRIIDAIPEEVLFGEIQKAVSDASWQSRLTRSYQSWRSVSFDEYLTLSHRLKEDRPTPEELDHFRKTYERVPTIQLQINMQ